MLRNVIGCAVLIVVLPVFLAIKILAMPFKRPFNRSADEVIQYLRDFLNGAGCDWDWDDFTSVPIADARLDDIRKRAAALALPLADDEKASLKGLIAEAENVAFDREI